MAENTSIEWCDHTWTPVVGCDAVSPACAKCYAALMAARLEAMGQEKYRGVATRVGNLGKWTGKVTFSEADLVKPLTVRRPGRWFLTSMGDVAHEALTGEQIAELFGVMAVAGADGPFHREQDGVTLGTPITWSDGTSTPSRWPNMRSGPHTFLVLTKRPARLHELLSDRGFRFAVSKAAYRWAHNRKTAGAMADAIYPPWMEFHGEPSRCWPMANVFIGCTAEDQEWADARRPHMRGIADLGWRTFVSYEPALGAVNWAGWEFLQQLISGGESGHGARPSHPGWHRAARDFCAANGIAYMFKQWGEWAPPRTQDDLRGLGDLMRAGKAVHVYGDDREPDGRFRRGDDHMLRVGKKAAGRQLDGIEHNGFPMVR